MESIRNQRSQLRTNASKAEGMIQQLEFAMLTALERIAEAIGLEKDAQPRQIAEVVEDVVQNSKYRASVLCDVGQVLAQNGLAGLPAADGVHALAGRAKTALQDRRILAERNAELAAQLTEMAQKVVRDEVGVQRSTKAELAMAERVKQLEKKNAQLAWELDAHKRQNVYLGEVNKAWTESAREFSNNAGYYRGLLVKVGEMFGVAAKTSDDGSVQQDVLVAKLPELVEELLDKQELLAWKPPTPNQPAPKQWLRVPDRDTDTRVGRLNCWFRDGIYRWCAPYWDDVHYPSLPGYCSAQMENLQTSGIPAGPDTDQQC